MYLIYRGKQFTNILKVMKKPSTYTPYQKEYYRKNKKRRQAYNKEYHKKNYIPKPKHLIKALPKDLREFIKNNPDLVILYYLKEEHYVGITTCKRLSGRMSSHKRYGNYVMDIEILGFYKRRV